MAFIQVLFNATVGAGVPHKVDNSKFVLTDEFLDDNFGTSELFHKLNDNLNIFQFSKHWDYKRRIAKEVNIRPKVHEKLWLHLIETVDTPSFLLNERGSRRRGPPNAILSKDNAGKTRSSITQLASSMVQVDRMSVKEYMHYLESQEKELLNKRPITIERILSRTRREQREWIVRARLQCLGLLHSSSLKGLPNEHLLQQYQECPSGRLYGVGFNLQNLVREVKAAALLGSWDHDIKSCHFTLIHQIAKKHGYHAKAIKEYIENKDEFHQRLFDQYGIEKDDAKTCMLSLIYGAPLTVYQQASIYRVLEDKAEVFAKDEAIQNIKNDLRKCMPLIIQDGHLSCGKLRNAMGKHLSMWETVSKGKRKGTRKKTSKNRLASHILQGYEALALHTAIEQLDGRIQLLCHDGFVTDTAIDTASMEAAMFEKTGLEIKLKSKILTPF
jgi:hypothetical protein